jgi:hypothetical protein
MRRRKSAPGATRFSVDPPTMTEMAALISEEPVLARGLYYRADWIPGEHNDQTPPPRRWLSPRAGHYRRISDLAAKMYPGPFGPLQQPLSSASQFESPQLHQVVRANRRDFRRPRSASHAWSLSPQISVSRVAMRQELAPRDRKWPLAANIGAKRADRTVAERNHPAPPDALFLGGGDLVPDAFACDFALQLGFVRNGVPQRWA